MRRKSIWLTSIPIVYTLGCSGSDVSTSRGSGGDTSLGGSSAVGGSSNAGGAVTTGGVPGLGGTQTGGGTAATGGSKAGGGTSSTGGAVSTSGAVGTGGSTGTCSGSCSNAAAGACAAPQVRVSPVSAGAAISFGTAETSVMPLALAAIPGGGSRLTWMTGYTTNGSSKNSLLHVAQLDCTDTLVGTPFTMEAYDFQDIAADGNGGVVMLTRDAQGGGTLNCGAVSNLCGTPPSPPDACYDMYMVRYDCSGGETWATKLTTSSATNPPYTFGSGQNLMVWWYQHQGRIAYDGTNYAGYFCDAITIQNTTCANNSTGTTGGVDIHEGDRMQVVGPTGTLLTGHDSFGIGCSHSGFTRIIWDQTAGHFIMTCQTDNNNRLAQPNPYRTIYPLTLSGSYVGDVVQSKSGGYWVTVSNNGTVHLLHFNNGAQSDQDISLATANYPHLVAYGANYMIAAWATAATGNMTAQVFDASTGAQVSPTFAVAIPGHPYQSFKSYPDGSVAFASVASSTATVQVARVMPCSG